MFGGFSILLLFLLPGEAVSFPGIPLPGNVLGMILLAAAFALGAVKVEQVKMAADILLKNMAFFFVPAGVGVMNHMGIIRSRPAVLGAVLIGSTAAVLVSVGLCHRFLIRRVPGWFRRKE